LRASFRTAKDRAKKDVAFGRDASHDAHIN